MIHVAYFDTTGRITSVASGTAAIFGDLPWAIKITKAQMATVLKTHCVDIKTRSLKAGALPDPSPPTWAEIRVQRNLLLSRYGLILSEFVLPDSYPNRSALNKATKVKAIINYRQALRDITKQPDPASITWPQEPKI